MGNSSSSGFTIIETVLFLAVSGLLILTIISGAGISINIQRYRDAVESFKSQLQSQYAETTNVQNGREANMACGANAKPVDDTNGDIRGQSTCVIAGKYLRIDDTNVTTYTVLAREVSTTVAPGDTDIQILSRNYVYNVSDTPDDDTSLSWGTSIGWPQGAGTNPRQIGILFLKSPYSGQTYTFSANTVPDKASINSTTFQSMIIDGTGVPGRGAQTLCIESDGLFVDDSEAVYIGENATGPTAIEVRTNAFLTGGVRC